MSERTFLNATRYGAHRVLNPANALPQAADRLDPSLPIRDEEILIRVDTLNVDSASFRQICGEVGREEEAVGERVREIVAARGKMQNPVTGSGGMLLGTVERRGPLYDTHPDVKVGTRVATLASLTLTPLHIDAVRRVHLDSDQVEIDGHAVLWPSAPLVAVPDDMDERLALSCLDVCGAPAQTQRLVRPGMKVAVIGAGKSGMLCMAQARESLRGIGRIAGVDLYEGALRDAHEAGLIDAWGTADAKDPLDLAETVLRLLGGQADLVINTANVAGTETGAALSVRDGGIVYYFNMATSFAAAALGTEGIGRDATLIIGNGFVPDHAHCGLGLLRRNAFVHQYFVRLLED